MIGHVFKLRPRHNLKHGPIDGSVVAIISGILSTIRVQLVKIVTGAAGLAWATPDSEAGTAPGSRL